MLNPVPDGALRRDRHMTASGDLPGARCLKIRDGSVHSEM